MRFADIPYHHDVKEHLRKLVDSNRIPHALLLEGPAGTDKFALARAMAQYIHCEHRTPDGDSCGKCPSCLQHQEFNHIDTIFTFPVVKKKSGGATLSDDYIAEFRELMTESQHMDFESWLMKLDNINAQPQIYVDDAHELIRKLSYTAHASEYKVVLMWLPERMKAETANKLLKLVEEPFHDTIFIMVSDNSRLILPTIYSRTQRVHVNRYSDEEVAAYLTSDYGISPDDAAQIAKISTGNITEAIKALNVSKERQLYLDLFKDLMRKAWTRSVADLKQWASDVADLGREREIRFLDYCARMIRENFILNLKTPDLNCMTADEGNFSAKFSPYINEYNVLQIFKTLNDATTDIAMNGNAKLINFDVAIKMILLLKKQKPA